MRLLIERTIELLKLQVKENLRLINKNQTKIAEIRKQPVSEEQKKIFNKCSADNKQLLIENNDFANLQHALANFLEKYKTSDILSNKIPEDYCDLPEDKSIIFDMTIDGELKFDNLHPYFDDDDFFNKLIHYYTSVEAYEKCGELYKVRKLYFSAR